MNIQLRRQALSIFAFVLALLGVGVVLQLWLLGAELEATLAGKSDLGVATVISSLAIFGIHGALLACVLRVDRRINA
ncbi:DUF6755 family protein [Pendulispora albinea]|uniref:Uncharacterized protein n=1 Tax=Pendulispora albinea TaxID=2741071 RepID=A0ABZ2M7J9_9BACT